VNASAACKKLEEFFTPGFAGLISGLLLVTLLALLGQGVAIRILLINNFA